MTNEPEKKTTKKANGLTEGEIAAMKETVKERNTDNGESAVLAKIAEMSEPDRSMAKRLHAIIKTSTPILSPKTWYGMPAYAKEDIVICFFQPGQKFKTRYATLGFSDKAHLDEGDMWPTTYALKKLTATEEAKIVALLKKSNT